MGEIKNLTSRIQFHAHAVSTRTKQGRGRDRDRELERDDQLADLHAGQISRLHCLNSTLIITKFKVFSPSSDEVSFSPFWSSLTHLTSVWKVRGK